MFQKYKGQNSLSFHMPNSCVTMPKTWISGHIINIYNALCDKFVKNRCVLAFASFEDEFSR